MWYLLHNEGYVFTLISVLNYFASAWLIQLHYFSFFLRNDGGRGSALLGCESLSLQGAFRFLYFSEGSSRIEMRTTAYDPDYNRRGFHVTYLIVRRSSKAFAVIYLGNNQPKCIMYLAHVSSSATVAFVSNSILQKMYWAAIEQSIFFFPRFFRPVHSFIAMLSLHIPFTILPQPMAQLPTVSFENVLTWYVQLQISKTRGIILERNENTGSRFC